jgi:hypothetical protein
VIGNMQTTLTISALGACLTWASWGSCQDESKQLCSSAYELAQVSMREGKLLEAQKDLIYCGSSKCPNVMHRDCERWLSDVNVSIPTVVFQLETSSGPTPVTATVLIDGGDSMSINGRALSVNPGRHDVTFSAPGLRTTSKSFVFSEGEKLRHEVVVLDPIPAASRDRNDVRPKPAARPEQRPGVRVTFPIVSASTAAVVGSVGTVYFGMTARAGDHDLAACAPTCSRGSVNRVKRNYLLTNASLGLAAVGLVTTAILLALEIRTANTPRVAHLGLEVDPTALGLTLNANF